MIVLFTDFGLEGPYTGQVKAVLYRTVPGVPVVELFADAPAGRPKPAAYLLATYGIWFPPGTVLLAVIDPGVGTERAALIIEAEGRWYVGPDNGLFELVIRRAATARTWEIARPAGPFSASFHGRDLFAPAAAHLAAGVPLDALGPPLAADALARLDLPEPEVGESRIHATVLYIDRFGNVQLNLTREHLQRAEVTPGTVVEVELALDRYYAVAARTFADARKGDVILYEDAYKNIALAISGGNAAELFAAAPGQEVRIRLQAI